MSTETKFVRVMRCSRCRHALAIVPDVLMAIAGSERTYRPKDRPEFVDVSYHARGNPAQTATARAANALVLAHHAERANEKCKGRVVTIDYKVPVVEVLEARVHAAGGRGGRVHARRRNGIRP